MAPNGLDTSPDSAYHISLTGRVKAAASGNRAAISTKGSESEISSSVSTKARNTWPSPSA